MLIVGDKWSRSIADYPREKATTREWVTVQLSNSQLYDALSYNLAVALASADDGWITVSRARIEVTFTIKITREVAIRGLAPRSKRDIGTFYFGSKSQTWHLSKMKRNKIMITCLSTIQAHDPRTRSHSLRTIAAKVQRCNRWAFRHQLPIAKLHRLPNTAITMTLISNEKARRSDRTTFVTRFDRLETRAVINHYERVIS